MNSRSKCQTSTIFACVLFAAACDTQQPRPPAEPAYFPAAEVCSYPASGPGKVFAPLSRGSWTPSNPDEPNAAFGCVGESKVQLVEGDGYAIEVEYSATGVEKGAALITLAYRASGDASRSNESTYRRAFGNLVDAVTLQGLGSDTPELFKRKLANLASYSQSGKGSAENFDLGTGFILLTREVSPTEIKISVKVFPDIALKIK